MAGWRYFATRLNGDGTETDLYPDIPLADSSYDKELSGYGGIFGSIEPEIMGLKDNRGNPVFVPWSTAIYAEQDGFIRESAIFNRFSVNGARLDMETVGWGGYLAGMPWVGAERQFVKTDALDLVRTIWSHVQSKPKGNLGLVLGTQKAGVTFGTEEKDVSFQTGAGQDVEFVAGPVRFNEWSTHNLGREIDDFATAAPFDWVIEHNWNEDRSAIEHTMRFGVPILGQHQRDLRFAVGENIIEIPEETVEGDEWFSDYLVLGAGEGSEMLRSYDSITHSRLRRVGVHSDPSLKSKRATADTARQLLKLNFEDGELQEIAVIDHPHAPIGSYTVGDIIPVTTHPGWLAADTTWYRILGITIEPETGVSRLSIVRSEKV